MQDKILTKKYFLEMVSASIQGLPIPVCPEDVDCNLLYKLCDRNTVQNILYLAKQNDNTNTNITLALENSCQLHKTYMASLAREATQQEEIAYIREAFTNENIEFMFLKGTHLKSLYPLSEMRFMVDMDILVKEKDMDKAGNIILSRGFTQKMNNGKDIVLIKWPFLTIELHKMLFVEDYFMHDYFSSVWDRVEKSSDFEYKMPINDLYVYTLAHLAEHYLEAGSCFRPLMDLYLMERKYSELDFDYINEQFKILGIEKFAKKIRQLYKCAFDGAEYNDDLVLMENYIVFGAPVKNAQAASQILASNESKFKKILKTLFPPYKHMALKYTIVEKLPILLPLFWVVRWFEYAFKKDSRAEERRKQIVNVKKETVNVMKEIFEKSGL